MLYVTTCYGLDRTVRETADCVSASVNSVVSTPGSATIADWLASGAAGYVGFLCLCVFIGAVGIVLRS